MEYQHQAPAVINICSTAQVPLSYLKTSIPFSWTTEKSKRTVNELNILTYIWKTSWHMMAQTNDRNQLTSLSASLHKLCSLLTTTTCFATNPYLLKTITERHTVSHLGCRLALYFFGAYSW